MKYLKNHENNLRRYLKLKDEFSFKLELLELTKDLNQEIIKAILRAGSDIYVNIDHCPSLVESFKKLASLKSIGILKDFEHFIKVLISLNKSKGEYGLILMSNDNLGEFLEDYERLAEVIDSLNREESPKVEIPSQLEIKYKTAFYKNKKAEKISNIHNYLHSLVDECNKCNISVEDSIINFQQRLNTKMTLKQIDSELKYLEPVFRDLNYKVLSNNVSSLAENKIFNLVPSVRVISYSGEYGMIISNQSDYSALVETLDNDYSLRDNKCRGVILGNTCYFFMKDTMEPIPLNILKRMEEALFRTFVMESTDFTIFNGLKIDPINLDLVPINLEFIKY